MRKISKSFYLWAVAAILTLAGAGWAAVESPLIQARAQGGFMVSFPLTLTSDKAVAGINGQLKFDERYFSNPRIEKGSSTSGFVVLGNEVDSANANEGLFNFIVYADPTANIPLPGQAANFTFDVSPNIEHSTLTQMSYQIQAASSAAAESLVTNFQPVVFSINSTEVQSDWSLYE